MFLDGSNLYVVSSTNGQLLKIGFVNGAPSGTSTVANATIDWRGRAVFLASVLPNVAPTAAFTYECAGISCTFDAGSSTDGDGTIQSYEWTFSDGDEAGGADPAEGLPGHRDLRRDAHRPRRRWAQRHDDPAGLGREAERAADRRLHATCDYLDCDFDATGSVDTDGTIDGYEWDFGDGQTGTGATPEHTYETPGSYETTLVVTDDSWPRTTSPPRRSWWARPHRARSRTSAERSIRATSPPRT